MNNLDHTPTTSLLADQRSRWDRGERPTVEHYLKRQPELNDNTEVLLDLIYAEVVLRREAGEDPIADEYVARFPALEEPIRTQFEVDEAIDDAATQFADADRNGPDYATIPPKTPPGYEILEQLGHGGMGVVFKAKQIGLDRLVAIKMIRSGELADPVERARFDAEARAVAKLSHPNIIQIYEVGETETGPFLALEYVPGKSLSDVLRETPHPPLQAASLIAVLARAVEHAHQAGVVHRDLKPANILLADTGRETRIPKITDFGLAKRIGSDKLTRTGDFLGTPNFAAPEQAAGKADVGPPADVYSLGAMLYQMLTGRPPFLGATPLETLDLVRFSEPVTPSRLRPNVPRDLETIALHCLNKEPAKRYRSAAALADDLDRFLNKQPIAARPVSAFEKGTKWCRRHPAITGMTAAIVLLIVASFIAVTTLWRSAVEARNSEAKAREDERIQNARADARSAEVLIANARHALITNDRDLAKRSLAECPADYRNADWNAIHRVCEAGQPFLEPGANVPDVIAVDEAGRFLAAGTSTGRLMCWRLADGEEVFSIPLVGKLPMSIAFDAEGRLIAALQTYQFDRENIRRDGFEIAAFDVPGGLQLWKTPLAERPVRSELSLDGKRAVNVLMRSRKAEILDVRTGKVLHTIECQVTSMARASFSPNGRYVITGAVPNEASIWDAENGFLVRRLEHPASFFGSSAFAVSDDADHAALGTSNGLKPGEIFLAHHKAEPQRFPSQLSTLSGLLIDPTCRWLAGFNGNESVIRVWDLRTGREEIAFRGYDSLVRCMTFTHDGKRIIAAGRDGRVVIWTLSP